MSETPKCPTCKRAQDVDLIWYCSNCGNRVDAYSVQRVLNAAEEYIADRVAGMLEKGWVDYDFLCDAVRAYKEMKKK